MRKTIAIDFDGTIVEHQFPNIGPLKKGVKEAMVALHIKYDLVIFTCRTSPILAGSQAEMRRREVDTFLRKNGIPFDRVASASEGKIVAEYYIDDRGIQFQDNWSEIVKYIEIFGDS